LLALSEVNVPTPRLVLLLAEVPLSVFSSVIALQFWMLYLLLLLLQTDNVICKTCQFLTAAVKLLVIHLSCSMEGSDLCLEVVKRARAGFVYSEAVARYSHGVTSLIRAVLITW